MSCRGDSTKEIRPTPPAGLAPVTVGELVQLRLAVEGFDSVFDARNEEQDLLPLLVHAWATFYHRPDPAPNAKARYAFTEALCRARFPKEKEPRSLFLCMDRLRESLLSDLVAVTQAFRRSGRSDAVGEHRLSELEKVFRQQRNLLAIASRHRAERRASLALPPATRCDLDQPRVPVLAVDAKSISLNGFPVVTAAKELPVPSASELKSMSTFLESRLLETSHSQGTQDTSEMPAQLVLMADQRLKGRTLLAMLSVAGRLGVQRVCLKAERLGSFRVPCCIPVKLAPPGLLPADHLELNTDGAVRVSGEQREALSPKETLSSDIPRTIRLHPGTTVLDLTALVERLAANTDQVPIILLTDTAKEKSLNTLMPAAPFDSTQRRQLLPSPSNPGFRMPSRDPP